MKNNIVPIVMIVLLILGLGGCGDEGEGGDSALQGSDNTNSVPVIEVTGNSSVSVKLGETDTDPGAVATDAEDGDLTAITWRSSGWFRSPRAPR